MVRVLRAPDSGGKEGLSTEVVSTRLLSVVMARGEKVNAVVILRMDVGRARRRWFVFQPFPAPGRALPGVAERSSASATGKRSRTMRRARVPG